MQCLLYAFNSDYEDAVEAGDATLGEDEELLAQEEEGENEDLRYNDRIELPDIASNPYVRC